MFSFLISRPNTAFLQIRFRLSCANILNLRATKLGASAYGASLTVEHTTNKPQVGSLTLIVKALLFDRINKNKEMRCHARWRSIWLGESGLRVSELCT